MNIFPTIVARVEESSSDENSDDHPHPHIDGPVGFERSYIRTSMVPQPHASVQSQNSSRVPRVVRIPHLGGRENKWLQESCL